jgi:benzodiazapine receptor
MYKKIKVFIFSIIGSYAAAVIGSLATTPNISTWYVTLEKPLFNPPNWIFGPVWSVLYALMGIALALIILEVTKKSKGRAYLWFAIQLMLNTLWSLVFFGLHSPWTGVAIIVMLVVSILITIREFSKINKTSAWLLVPYIAWVTFATYLTFGIALLNN